MRRKPTPPSGYPPPERAETPTGEVVWLWPLAAEICRRYRDEYPDEEQRYGEPGIAWCVHDNQHILNWAILALSGFVSLDDKLAWLARVLESRDFPLERLIRDLELAADVVGERLKDDHTLPDLLTAGAEFLRSKSSFL